MRALPFRVGLGNQQARFAQPEIKLPKHVLALTYSQRDPKALLDPGAERLAVPEVPTEAKLLRTPAQRSIHRLELPLLQAARTSWPLAFPQPGKSLCFESTNPILHRSGSVTEQLGDFQTAQPLSHEQQPVQAMIVTGLRRVTDLLLQPKDDTGSVCDGESLHVSIKSQLLNMRNYLVRYV